MTLSSNTSKISVFINTESGLWIKFLYHFKTLPKTIIIIFVASLFVLFLKGCWLNYIPEPILGLAVVGSMVDNICYSILASCLFWFVVSHLQFEKDKANVLPFIATNIDAIISDCRYQLYAFIVPPEAFCQSLNNLTKSQIENAFKEIKPMGLSKDFHPFKVQKLTWLEFMDFFRVQTASKIDKLFRRITLLDSDLVRILCKIDDCAHFRSLTNTIPLISNEIQITDTDMTGWAEGYLSYCVLIRELIQYRERTLT